jgi:hypothetical protein
MVKIKADGPGKGYSQSKQLDWQTNTDWGSQGTPDTAYRQWIGDAAYRRMGFRGVYGPRRGHFRALISFAGHTRAIGTYESPESAAIAYDTALGAILVLQGRDIDLNDFTSWRSHTAFKVLMGVHGDAARWTKLWDTMLPERIRIRDMVWYDWSQSGLTK